MKKILLVVTAIVTLASCNKTSYTVTGEIAGIENGKEVILQTQDEMGQLKSVDTVKIENGKFVFEGEAKEPLIYLLQIDKLQGKVVFILENGDIDMTINKDSLNNAKISGTYNNDEFTTFKNEGMKIQKKIMKFQTDNMAAFTEAQQKMDTVTLNKLSKDYRVIQEEYTTYSVEYAKTHPKAYISALIIESMFNQMNPDIDKITGYYNGLDQSIKDTKTGKSIKTKLDQFKSATTTPPPAPTSAPAPTAAPGEGDSN